VWKASLVASGYTQDVIILGGGLERRDRTSASGITKSRYTISVESTPLVHNFDELPLGQGPAEAMADVLKTKMRNITAFAKPATIARRKRAAIELAKGDPAAVRRYSGGRMVNAEGVSGGPMPPSTGASRLFNDSGRFIGGIVVMRNKVEKGFTINIPANRLDPTTFTGGEAALAAMYARLVALVPEFADARLLMESPEVEKAILDGIKGLIGASQGRLEASMLTRWKSAVELARGVGNLGRMLGGL
jgi:hypothetical protein